VDSELVGHVRGAFTGANADRKGAFVRARGGTVFLDELDGISPDVQARLLRVLEARTVRPVGSDRDEPIDVRLVAATQAPLSVAVANGSFRADLFYRIAVLHLRLPALRERREDLAPIVRELLLRRGFEVDTLAPERLQRLAAPDWPGNVRELRNVLDRAIALSPGATRFDELRLWHQPSTVDGGLQVRTDIPYAEAKAVVVDELERRYLSVVWAEADGNVSAAARRAGLDRKHLRGLLRKHGLIDA
jgi:DNA-binding NtrC family response regulator